MNMPSVAQVLAEFKALPHRFLVDMKIYQETWKWAYEMGDYPPTPTFSYDETPVLSWLLTLDEGDEDAGPVYQTASGIVLYS